jgi:hypothetical protein
MRRNDVGNGDGQAIGCRSEYQTSDRCLEDIIGVEELKVGRWADILIQH